jgi:hypothetical protein
MEEFEKRISEMRDNNVSEDCIMKLINEFMEIIKTEPEKMEEFLRKFEEEEKNEREEQDKKKEEKKEWKKIEPIEYKYNIKSMMT